jgi:flagellar basal-body rod modification protein FlgD
MAIDAIGGTVGSGANELQRAGVNQEDFIRLFLTQLSFQDPLEPVDNREFLAQLAQFTAVEEQRTLNANLEALLSVQASGQAIALLGKTVEVATATGSVVGEVTTLSFRTGKPLLTVVQSDGTVLQDVSPVQITLVRQ